jgi:hypothetical protein
MSYLNATHAGKGYEQSGGGYFYVVDTVLATKLLVWGTSNLPAGSGGAWTVGSFTAAQSVTNALPGQTSSLFSQGRVVRDMGKSLVSAGRTFRKIKGMVPNASGTAGVNATSVFNTDGGVGAGVVNGIDQGYLTFFVETTRDGDVQANGGALGGASAPAGLVRFM